MGRKLPETIKDIRQCMSSVINDRINDVVCLDPENRIFAIKRFIFQQRGVNAVYVKDDGSTEVLCKLSTSEANKLGKLRSEAKEQLKLLCLFEVGKRMDGKPADIPELQQIKTLAGEVFDYDYDTGKEIKKQNPFIVLPKDFVTDNEYRLEGYKCGVWDEELETSE